MLQNSRLCFNSEPSGGGRDKIMMYHPIHRRTQNWSAVCCSQQNTSLWKIHRNYPRYLGWHNYHFSFMCALMITKCLREPTKKIKKKDFYTYIHINTLIQRYIRKDLSARFCTLILNSMPLQGLAISDQESGNEAVRV